ncbi:MAG: hypothetical protein ABI864_05395 [Chloroflexota bacterium]
MAAASFRKGKIRPAAVVASRWGHVMVSFGVLLVVVGIGSFALPAAGITSGFLDSLDRVQPWLGIIVAAVGLITILFDQRRRTSVQTQTTVVSDDGPTSRDED